MDYWLSVLDEIVDQTGISLTSDQMDQAAAMLERAASVHGEYTSHSEPASRPAPVKEPESARAWWEDRSQLVGSDWVLAGQIQHMINSRYGA